MPVFDEGIASTGTDGAKVLELAATEAEASPEQARPFVTGDALANEEQETARNFKLKNSVADGEIDPRRYFRAPAARRAATNAPLPPLPDDAESQTAGRRALPKDEKPLYTSDLETLYIPPQEREKVARAAPEEVTIEADLPETASSPPAPAAAQPSADDEGARLERELLEGADPNVVSNDLPDVEIDVVGRKIPLSRIRAGDEALRNRLKVEQEFAQKNQAMNTAWKHVMEEEARGIRGDLIGAARRLGMSDSEISAQFAKNGLSPNSAAAPMNSPNVTSLPEDADPLAKALFAENRAKDRKLLELSQRVDGMEQSTAQERVQRSREATERARLATLSGVKQDLKATALKMPSMRDASGKLSPLASVLVDTTALLVDRELNSDTIPEYAAVRSRAIHLFGEKAREHGVTSKADQARRAIEQRKPPVPARAGTTNSGVYPGSPNAQAAGTPRRAAFDWSDDDQRKRAMRAEMARIEAELTG